MYIAVYAICKNEIEFVERWVASMSEADIIVVLDTGSTDGTAERLRELGVHVTEETIEPWRFDIARNISLSLVPDDADICICTDLDELFVSGWREKVEAAWKHDTGQARYRYTWSFEPDGSEGVVFFQEKMHRRQGYKWVHPVHEVLKWTGDGEQGTTVTAYGVQLNHYPNAAKSRAQYLPLLEMAVEEAPEDDRCTHYLGREYMYHQRWDDCIRTLAHHLAMPSARWRDERAASMRYIAKAYLKKGERKNARDWYLLAIAEAPYLREAYIDLAMMLYEDKQWEGVLYFTACALEISERPISYICDADAWGSRPHDLRSIAYFNTGRFEFALSEAETALEISPDDKRIADNAKLIRKVLAHS